MLNILVFKIKNTNLLFQKLLNFNKKKISLYFKEDNFKEIFNLLCVAFLEDIQYQRNFEKATGKEIYKLHQKQSFISCAFCSHLIRSSCHKYCFSCDKNTYTHCSCLLPGTYPFTDNLQSSAQIIPWLYKTPCKGFESLNQKDYFYNFKSYNSYITTSNFEVLEGIFLGQLYDKRPCHICASVNIEIYNKCVEQNKNTLNRPCNEISKELSKYYNAIE